MQETIVNTFEARHQDMNHRLKTLKRALQIMPHDNSPKHLLMRDGMIQRFEYCTDLFWKVLKDYLETVKGVHFEEVYPKGVITTALQSGTITQSEHQALLNAIGDRNRTSHIYKEEVAEQISKNIVEYYSVFEAVFEKLT